MQLSVKDRLLLLNILPAEGDLTTLRIVRKLQEELSFTEEEHAVLRFVQEGSQVKWDTTNEMVKDFTFGAKANGLIVDSLKRLNAEKRLRMEHLGLYESFVPPED